MLKVLSWPGPDRREKTCVVSGSHTGFIIQEKAAFEPDCDDIDTRGVGARTISPYRHPTHRCFNNRNPVFRKLSQPAYGW
jgi:hypothetical protein